MNVTSSINRAFAIQWMEIDRWIIPSRLLHNNSLPSGWKLVRLGSIVRQFRERVRVQGINEYKMAGVRWYGEGVFHRETVLGDELSAITIAPLVPGALIYNRLFAWKASFAVVPSTLADCFVSNEFPQFIPDSTCLDPEYLYLYLTRDSTIRAVGSASTGSAAVSRNRFKEEEFIDLWIPLPPLSEQRAIVARWKSAQNEIAAANERAIKIRAAVDRTFFSDLGLVSPEQVSAPKAFAVWWRDVQRWGTRFNSLAQCGADLTKGKYPVVKLGSVLKFLQYGTSEKANSAGQGTPVLRIGNVKNGILSATDLKHISLSQEQREGLLLERGDVLIIRTSGSRDLVGTCAVFELNGEFVFASYLIRLRFDTAKVAPEFVACFLNSALGRVQVDAVSREIMMNNINTEELRGLEIPLPPLDIQKQIMKRVQTGRAEIAREQQAAERLALEINREMEELILGSKKLDGAVLVLAQAPQ